MRAYSVKLLICTGLAVAQEDDAPNNVRAAAPSSVQLQCAVSPDAPVQRLRQRVPAFFRLRS